MANMNPKKNPMPCQTPEARARNFDEVALGYDAATALDEAQRCLGCKNPACVAGCPVNVNIPGFIKHICEGDYEGAYAVIKESNALPAVCGRICPQETQCESKCVRGKNGEPVLQLKTAFGGGKTHSLLALYHMARGGVALDQLPNLRGVLNQAGFRQIPNAKVAVIVGTAIDPAKSKRPNNRKYKNK